MSGAASKAVGPFAYGQLNLKSFSFFWEKTAAFFHELGYI
jgi:hypothetical protein